MPIRLDKPWRTLSEARLQLRGNLGVFEFADALGSVVYIGCADARSRFGLKGEIEDLAKRIPEAVHVRWEVTSAYQSRFRELLAAHAADLGALPKHNLALGHRPGSLGRLSPA